MLDELERGLLDFISSGEAGEGAWLHLKHSTFPLMVTSHQRPVERLQRLGSSSEDGWHVISNACLFHV